MCISCFFVSRRNLRYRFEGDKGGGRELCNVINDFESNQDDGRYRYFIAISCNYLGSSIINNNRICV